MAGPLGEGELPVAYSVIGPLNAQCGVTCATSMGASCGWSLLPDRAAHSETASRSQPHEQTTSQGALTRSPSPLGVHIGVSPCRPVLALLQPSALGFAGLSVRLRLASPQPLGGLLPPGVTLQYLGNLGRPPGDLARLSGDLGLMSSFRLPLRLFGAGRNTRGGGARRWWRVAGRPRSSLRFR